MSEASTEPGDYAEPGGFDDGDDDVVDAEPVDDDDAPADDDVVDAEILDDDAPRDQDRVEVEVEAPPGKEVEPYDPDKILDVEAEEVPEPAATSRQRDDDGKLPGGGPNSGGGGGSGRRKRGLKGVKRGKGGFGGGTGGGDNVLFKNEKHVHKTVNMPGSHIGNGNTGIKTTVSGGSPGSRGRRPRAGKRR